MARQDALGDAHVGGCRCDDCEAGRTRQHVVGCQCKDCAAQRGVGGGLRGIFADVKRDLGGLIRRAEKAADAYESISEAASKAADVLTPAERRAIGAVVKKVLGR